MTLSEVDVHYVSTLEQASTSWVQEMDRDPQIGSIIRGDASPEAYVGFLAGTYHYIRWSGPLLARTAAGLQRAGASSWLYDLVDRKTAEEAPHDRWVLANLRRCGENVELIKSAPTPGAVQAYVQWSLTLADAGSPAFLGAAYTLEIISMHRAGLAARNLRARRAIPHIEDAVSFLEGHGDTDAGHIEHLNAALRRIHDSADRSDVLLSAAVMRTLYPGFSVPARRPERASRERRTMPWKACTPSSPATRAQSRTPSASAGRSMSRRRGSSRPPPALAGARSTPTTTATPPFTSSYTPVPNRWAPCASSCPMRRPRVGRAAGSASSWAQSVTWTISRRRGSPRAEVTRFCVLRRYRCTGVAAALFAGLFAESQRRGITHWVAGANMETDFAEDAALAYRVARAQHLVSSRFHAAPRVPPPARTPRQRPLYTEAQRLRAAGGDLAGISLPRPLYDLREPDGRTLRRSTRVRRLLRAVRAPSGDGARRSPSARAPLCSPLGGRKRDRRSVASGQAEPAPSYSPGCRPPSRRLHATLHGDLAGVDGRSPVQLAEKLPLGSSGSLHSIAGVRTMTSSLPHGLTGAAPMSGAPSALFELRTAQLTGREVAVVSFHGRESISRPFSFEIFSMSPARSVCSTRPSSGSLPA